MREKGAMAGTALDAECLGNLEFDSQFLRYRLCTDRSAAYSPLRMRDVGGR